VIFGILLLFIYTQYSSPVSLGPWTATTSYPLQSGGNYGVVGQACVTTAGYVYCVGGSDGNGNPSNQVFSSTLSISGLGNWTSESSPYPRNVTGQSCVAYSGYLYCVGGSYDIAGDNTPSSYFASLSTLNVNTWTETTAFPVPVDTESCVSSQGYIYCVGGNNQTAGTNATSELSNSVWYATLSPSGIGSWSRTTSYPENFFLPSCVASNSYIYCLGGINHDSTIKGGINYGALSNTQNTVYYAALSSTGLGPWMTTTNYPIQIAFQSCGVSSSSIYCVGGEQSGGSTFDGVYYSSLSSSGIGTWHKASNYPLEVTTICVSSNSTLYCLGGYDSVQIGLINPSNLINTDYYSPLSSVSDTNSSSQ
jgi:N-acetylneuraminic acid mutarotase